MSDYIWEITNEIILNNNLIDKYSQHRLKEPCYVTSDNDKINIGIHNRVINILNDYYKNKLTIKQLSLKYETSASNVRSHIKRSLWVMTKLYNREINPPKNHSYASTKGMKLTPYGYYLPKDIYDKKYGEAKQ